MMKRIKLFEMFAGYGGASFALKKADLPFECVGFSEIDYHAINAYTQNHTHTYFNRTATGGWTFPHNYGDCRDLNPEVLPDFDLLTGGFPCQPFSIAKAMFTHFFKVVGKGVAIYRCDNMETTVWQDIILKNADWIFIPKGRIAYTPFETGNMRNGVGTRFPSALIGLRVPPPQNLAGAILLTTKATNSEGKNE